MARKTSSKTESTANLGFEQKLWLAADKLRNNMDAAEYKHVVLGLIFLKYISDTFDEHHAKLVAGQGDFAGANPEDKDEYLAANVFWVPVDARWPQLQSRAKLPSIGKDVDDAMVPLERDNPRLKGALNKNYGRADLDTAQRDSAFPPREATPQSLSAAKDKHRLGELIDLIGSIQLVDVASRSKDLLGRVFEYFLTQFASAEGKNGGHSSGARKTAAGSPQGERGAVHQFYTPSCVVRLLVEMLAPFKGRIYDPACGSGGMPCSSESRSEAETASRRLPAGRAKRGNFVESHGGQLGDISIYGQDKRARRQRPFGLAPRARRVRLRRQQPKQSNPTTRRLAIMNLALRGIEADFGPENADTFRRDLHPDLRADYVLATAMRDSAITKAKPCRKACRRQDNPTPFNDSDTALRGSAFLQSEALPQVVSAAKDNFRKDDDVRWQYGVPPKGNANFAWVQHFIHHLAPAGPGSAGGMAGFVLANGSMSSNQSGEGDIRQKLIEADLVDCMVALPGQLFYSTQIPVCLWFLAKSKAADAKRDFREHRQQTLFIDARKMGTLIDRVHRELTDADLKKIVSTYHSWRGDSGTQVSGLKSQVSTSAYADVAGFCKSATTAEITAHGHVLTPGRYVGAEEVEGDGEPFEEKMPRLVAELQGQFAESTKLEKMINTNLKGLGFGI